MNQYPRKTTKCFKCAENLKIYYAIVNQGSRSLYIVISYVGVMKTLRMLFANQNSVVLKY